MAESLIDVIVPVYNGAKYIPAFLDRMEQQADEAVRFLFVDDGSEDETLKLLREAGEIRRLPMKIIPGKHAGVSAARNAGIEAAEADYIAFFDIDDTCSADYTAVLRKEAEQGGFDVLVFFRIILFDPAGSVPVQKAAISREVPKAEMLRAILLDEHRNSTGIYTLLLKRSFIAENRLRFAEGYPYYEDGHFQYRALALADHVFRLDRQLYGYLVKHEGSAMARFTPERVRCLELHHRLESFFDERVPDFAPLFRQYAVARIYWSILWQAALISPSVKDFLRFADRTWAKTWMHRLKGYPDPKVRILRRLYLVSRFLYYRTAKCLGGRFTLLGRTTAETLEASARVCPDPGESTAVTPPMDLVYLYVNGSDPEWLKQREQAAESRVGAESCRFRDNGELMYSLRSVEEHASSLQYPLRKAYGESSSMKLQSKNTAASMTFTLVGILCGLILPRAILLQYGTGMNGMLQAVTRFLQFSVVFELGLGAVIPAALYPPLTARDYPRVSAILSSSYRSFRRIALALVAYFGLLILFFPLMTGNVYPRETSAWLIVCAGVGTLVPYWAGIPDNLLLISDQKGYIASCLAIGSTVLTTLASLLLIRANVSLAIVKLAGSVITILAVWFACFYVSRHYPVSRHVRYEEEPIPQKWNGIAQHIAYVVLEYTDILLLTVMMTFREVSVYSVYAMVLISMRHLFSSATDSVQPKLGELWARSEKKALNRFFSSFECTIHLAVSCLFSCTGILIVPFIRIYTAGVTDAEYVQPVFAAVMTLAFAFQCLRDPYEKMILAAGHFRQTQKCNIVAACLNIGLSIVFVLRWGIVGVAAGTLAAMIYQTGYMAWYDSRVLLRRPLRRVLAPLAVDLTVTGLILLSSLPLRLQPADFLSWLGLAAIVTAIAVGITLVVALLFCRKTLFPRGIFPRDPKRADGK